MVIYNVVLELMLLVVFIVFIYVFIINISELGVFYKDLIESIDFCFFINEWKFFINKEIKLFNIFLGFFVYN